MKMICRMLKIAMILAMLTLGLFVYRGYRTSQLILAEDPLADKIAAIQSGENYTYIDEIPELYKQAVIAVEDKRFYEHNGIDLIAVLRSVIHDIQSLSFKEGGSTISQQLAKNLYFTQEKTIQRKIAEAFIALKIEKYLSKDEILELYVNVIYYGNGYYSIKEAAQGYFGKDPKDLTDYESTWLAGIPNAPSIYGSDEELASKRQQIVISRMIECGFIDPSDNLTLEVMTN